MCSGDYARGYRVIGLPFICFGAAVMAMAVQRICGVIWLLGKPRIARSALVAVKAHRTARCRRGSSDAALGTATGERSEQLDRPLEQQLGVAQLLGWRVGLWQRGRHVGEHGWLGEPVPMGGV